MGDIFDYIQWRGDLTFAQTPLNCVDSLIFSQMAYFPFDGLWEESENGSVSIAEAWKRLKEKKACSRKPENQPVRFHMEKDEYLFEAMAGSPRFGGLVLRDYVNRIEPEKEKQFAAVTVLLPDITVAVYRGTDQTLVGWKEDFNMSFSTPVPAQIDAAKYLSRAASVVLGPLAACGHSKGGNLAVYAALFCEEDVQRRIKAVYNHDGPGFDGRVVPKEIFRILEGRLHTFVPQSSVIGMLMEHEENYTVVRSRQIGILQHDLYSWEVMGANFVCLESVTDGSRFVDLTLKEWLGRMDSSQRENFIDTVFSVLGATEASSFSDLKENMLKNSGTILKAAMKIAPEERRTAHHILSQLIDSAQDTMHEFFVKQ